MYSISLCLKYLKIGSDPFTDGYFKLESSNVSN